MRLSRLTLTMLALTLVAVVASAQPPTPAPAVAEQDWTLEQETWSAPIAPTRPVKVMQMVGDFLIRGIEGATEIEVYSTVQHHNDDPRPPVISVREEGEHTVVEVQFDDASVALPGKAPDAWRKRRIDVTVLVPATTPLDVRTLHGRGKVKSMRSDVVAHSESGILEIATKGSVRATNNYGSIHADMGSASWSSPLAFETVSGIVRVDLPWEAVFVADIETRGAITSDYSIDIAWQEGSSLKRGQVSNGRDDSKIRVKSHQGNVRLLRKLDTFRESRPATPKSTRGGDE